MFFVRYNILQQANPLRKNNLKEENKENINDYERNYYNLKYDKEKMHNEDVLFQKKNNK